MAIPDRQSSEFEPALIRQSNEQRTEIGTAVSNRVASYAILHTAREATFDRLIFTTAQIFRVPVALIALVAETGFWLKAQVGLNVSELPANSGLGNILDQDDVLVVDDMTRDARFAGSPFLSGPPHCRFLSGASLITPDGLRVGCLCVMDKTAKPLLGRQVWQLAQMARSVVGALEARLPADPRQT